jgi:hypothetical protein
MKPPPVLPANRHTITLIMIGRKLTELRIKKGYKNRTDFILNYELSHIQYWRMEKGLANLTFKSLDKILEIHGLTIESFFEVMLAERKRNPGGRKNN